jgi:hypothetical protein
MTGHRDKFLYQLDALISLFIFGIKLYMFRTVPLSIIKEFCHCTHSKGMCHTACEQDQDANFSNLFLE